MPELPEVETVRRGLVRARLRAPIVTVWRSAKLLRTGEAWRQENLEALVGACPGKVQRRGKFLIWHLKSPRGASLGWLVHLGMSGRFLLPRPGTPRAPHTHAVVSFADGREVRFVDPRRFGGMRVAGIDTLLGEPPLSKLGPEPLSRNFDPECLATAAKRSTRALRDVLLDQRVVAGVGNIYANEALFEAGLHPLLPANRLSPAAWTRLAHAVVLVLRRGLRNGGTTLRDYRDPEGRQGRNQDVLNVYGRAGQACRRCRATIRGFVLGGRGGAYCPTHQRRPRTRTVP